MQAFEVCYVCNRFVEDKSKHKCPEAKKLLKHPKTMDAPHMHSDGLPTRTKGFVV